MAEMVKHDAAVACYGRWDDQTKAWDAAKDMLGIHVEGKIVADVIVDTAEEIEALPDEQEVVVPVENVQGPVVKADETEAEDEGEAEGGNDPEDPAEPTDPEVDPEDDPEVDPETEE
jgi:hypothetical protein